MDKNRKIKCAYFSNFIEKGVQIKLQNAHWLKNASFV